MAEIRLMLGNVSRQRASAIANQRNFPEPIAVLAMGKVWRKSPRHHRPGVAPHDGVGYSELAAR